MQYKKSQYNIFVPYKDRETIIFNSLTGAIGKFDESSMIHYNNCDFSSDECKLLIEKGILVEKNYDERKKINSDRTQGILDKHTKYLRIWTTSACNARCYYCFENGIPAISMTEKTADSLIKFIYSIMEKGDILNLEWFGGEPLVNSNIIDYIMEKLQPISDDNKWKLVCSMISNGSLIDENIASKMKNKWHISFIQITLDGYDREYDRIKNYIDTNKFNFWKVIEGIKLLNDYGIQVAVRMNYDTSNYDSLTKLIEYLHFELTERKHIYYYIYPVWSALNEEDKNSFCSMTEADDNYVKLLKLLVQYEMNSIRKVTRLNYRKNQCKSCHVNGYVIFPDGKLGKCSETFVQTIGDIWNGVIDKETYNVWTSVAIDKKCEECVYLPLCQGGCRSSKYTKMPQCFAHKNVLSDILKWYVESMDEKVKKGGR